MIDEAASTQTDTVELPETIELTREGLDRLQAELASLRADRRPALVKQVRRATLFMDQASGEDAANVARYDLGVLDQQIAHLEVVIERAQVDQGRPDTGTVRLGSQVTVRYEDGTEETLTLVGPLEADPSRGYVSNTSPAGQVLLGKSAGADVTIGTGDNELSFTVIAIEQQVSSDDSTSTERA